MLTMATLLGQNYSPKLGSSKVVIHVWKFALHSQYELEYKETLEIT